MSAVSTDNQRTALGAFAHTGQAFFTNQGGLADVVAAIPLPSAFAAEWFLALLKRFGDDLASHGIWSAVERYCETVPASALEVLDAYETAASSELHDQVAQRIIGTLRTVTMTGTEQRRFAEAAARWATSPDPARRLLFLRSWVHTAWRGGMNSGELEKLLGAPASAQEHDARFAAVCRIVTAPRLSDECFAAAFEWLRRHAAPGLSPSAKHELVEAANSLGASTPRQSRAVPNLWEPLLAIQPIAPEHTGTWRRLQDFLIAVMHGSPAEFERMVLELCHRSGGAMVQLIHSGDGLDALLSGMSLRKWERLIAQLMFASGPLSRRIGLFLFEKLGVHEFPADVLQPLAERDLLLALFGFQASSPHGEVIARFLLAILPRVETARASVREEFGEELLLQSKNYPSACLDALKASGSKSPLVAQTIAKADAYFADFRPTQGASPLNSMMVPALAFVARSKRRAIDRDIKEGAERGSVFAQFMKNVDILYGDAFCSFADGQLDGPTPMQEHIIDMEFPRLEAIDPERMALRRWNALEMIARLENERLANP